MYISVYVLSNAHMEARRGLWLSSSAALYLITLGQVSYCSLVRLVVSELQRVPCLYHAGVGVIDTYVYDNLFIWVAGIQSQVLMVAH